MLENNNCAVSSKTLILSVSLLRTYVTVLTRVVINVFKIMHTVTRYIVGHIFLFRVASQPEVNASHCRNINNHHGLKHRYTYVSDTSDTVIWKR